MINLNGINRKNKHRVQYPKFSSTISLIQHSPDLPYSEPDCSTKCGSDSERSNVTIIAGDDTCKPEEDGL